MCRFVYKSRLLRNGLLSSLCMRSTDPVASCQPARADMPDEVFSSSSWANARILEFHPLWWKSAAAEVFTFIPFADALIRSDLEKRKSKHNACCRMCCDAGCEHGCAHRRPSAGRKSDDLLTRACLFICHQPISSPDQAPAFLHH